MGLFDSVVGALAGGGAQGGSAGGLLGAVTSLLGPDGGGIAGLVTKFQQGGMGDVVNSWISNGHNLPISPEQLHAVLGNETIAGLAQQLGLSHGDLAGQLSQLLPQVVDKLTPNGQLPAGGAPASAELSSLLGSLLK